jgi:hypothetical protein
MAHLTLFEFQYSEMLHVLIPLEDVTYGLILLSFLEKRRIPSFTFAPSLYF